MTATIASASVPFPPTTARPAAAHNSSARGCENCRSSPFCRLVLSRRVISFGPCLRQPAFRLSRRQTFRCGVQIAKDAVEPLLRIRRCVDRRRLGHRHDPISMWLSSPRWHHG
jgi:hypothetical protein